MTMNKAGKIAPYLLLAVSLGLWISLVFPKQGTMPKYVLIEGAVENGICKGKTILLAQWIKGTDGWHLGKPQCVPFAGP